MGRRLRHLVRALVRRRALDDALTDEFQFHLDARTADLTAQGLSLDAARRQARLEFGTAGTHREDARQAAGLSLLADLGADLRYAVRVARRQPAFTLAALLSLALGIGVNTLVFSVASGLVWRPLPVARPDQLVAIDGALSYPAYRDIRDRSTTFAGLAGYRIAPMSVEAGGAASRAWGYLATGNYFDLLGVTPAAGRFFHQDEDQPPARSPVAVLSYDYWIGRFGGAAAVVGSTVRINGQPYTVLGVAPRGFIGTEIFYRPDIWVPMTMQPEIEARSSWLTQRSTMNTLVIGRLGPAAPRGAAQADLTALSASLAREYPATDQGLRLTLSDPGLMGDTLRSPIKAFSLGLLGLALLVLLMACVNLAVMLTARGADRQKELAVRLSIGASAGRIVRQLLTESLLNSLIGGAAGLLIAVVAARLLSAWRPPVDVPIQFNVTPDPGVFLFAFVVAALAGLSFGLAPALQASRTDTQSALKGAVLASRPRRRWALRDLLVAGQVAICFLLVAGCFLALRGLQSALTMPIGYDPHGVTMVGYDLGLAGYTPDRGALFEARALESVQHLPGIDTAAFADTIPLYLNESTTMAIPDDHPDLPLASRPSVSRYAVSAGYFATMRTRLLAGRPIEATDTATTPLVAVVNQTFARRVFGTANPIGRHFKEGGGGPWVEVVGLAEDGKYQSLSEAPRLAMFRAVSQSYQATISLVVRSGLPTPELLAEVRQAFAALDPTLALYETQKLDDMLGVVLLPSRAAAIALGAFGLLALVLALTGLHGIIAHAVSQRHKEIGIRVAIGARPAAVLRLVLARTLALLVIGLLTGLGLVWLARPVLASIVYQASPRDPWVVLAVALALSVVGLGAAWAPASRALRVSPVRALRED